VVAPQPWGVVTAKDKRLYVHVLNGPAQPYIFIPGLTQTVTRALRMNNHKVLKYKQQPEGLFIYLAEQPQNEMDTIIQLETR
jgi:alpha-L-fucosidase